MFKTLSYKVYLSYYSFPKERFGTLHCQKPVDSKRTGESKVDARVPNDIKSRRGSNKIRTFWEHNPEASPEDSIQPVGRYKAYINNSQQQHIY